MSVANSFLERFYPWHFVVGKGFPFMTSALRGEGTWVFGPKADRGGRDSFMSQEISDVDH